MRWKLSLAIVMVAAVTTAFWLYHHRSEALYDRIIHQDGYSLSLIQEGVAAEFFLKPEWIPKEKDAKTELNLVVAELFDTDIVLEGVLRQEDGVHIQIAAVPKPNRSAGLTLSTYLIENGGFTSTSGNEWTVTDAAGNDLLKDGYGSGEGSGNHNWVVIRTEDLAKLEQGAYVRHAGYYLYAYRQLENGAAAFWLPALVTIALILALAKLYRSRTEPEKSLGWKLVGYTLLGGFTLGLNEVKLPLGFVVYKLFLRKSERNAVVKHRAALLGLVLYASQLVTPWVAGMADAPSPKTSVVEGVSAEQIGIGSVWKIAAALAPASPQARVQSFEASVSSNGELRGLRFRLAEPDGERRYIHTEVVYDAAGQAIALERSASDEWLQFPRTMPADRFFERLQSLRMLELKPVDAVEHGMVEFSLMEHGTVNFGIKDAHTFGVDEDGAYPIPNERLPVSGLVMVSCGKPEAPESESYRGCDNPTYYLFEPAGGPLR
ncbi:hypothetical protein MO973_10870 [Paenibacillus sp. TRM 82003]|nr:hypothetical protein [Paenibacillus sp. TRM 82003]